MDSSTKASATLSKAVVRSAEYLGITDSLSFILGLDSETVHSLCEGTYVLNQERTNEWESAVLFVRLFIVLDTVMGNQVTARAWLHGFNTAFAQPPIDEIRSLKGLASVVEYLESQILG